MPKMKLEFDGFDEAIARLKKLDGNVRETATKALLEVDEYVTSNAHAAMTPHRRTGRTEKSIVDEVSVSWNGNIGITHVGFDIPHGGLPSVFLMYGTPRMKKDQKLYDAFYGATTRKTIRQIQEDVFYDEIRKLGG